MKPRWLRTTLSGGYPEGRVKRLLKNLDLNTVCDQAKCPNRGHCYQRNTAAFLILGRVCTRNCGYCAVTHGTPEPPDSGEPARLARGASTLGLKYAVVTSVTRDDLPDRGAGAFRDTVTALKEALAGVRVEVLTPDFRDAPDALHTVAEASPHIFNHNLETVERLFPSLRPGGDYRLSLEVLAGYRKLTGAPTKSGLMLGLGETREDVEKALEHLREAGVSILTLGQYLSPTVNHAPVSRYITPDEFREWAAKAMEMGFESVASGPLVRSSYHADSYGPPLL